MKNNILYRRKNRKGFTLAELLMTVAILLIVFALAVPAVFAIQRNLRQKELDSKAEIIYTAVQDKLTELYSKGQTSKYDPKQHTTDIFSIGSEMPGDYEVTTLDKTDASGNVAYMVQSIYYFTSDSALGQEIIGNDVLSDDLKNGHWVVEYIPYAAYESDDRNPNTTKLTSATVYGVYYSEDYEIQEKGNTYSYANEDNTITEVYRTGYPDGYREKDNRKDKNKGDARIGYYGGSTAGSGSDTSKIELLTLKINSSDEINTAEVKVKAPSANIKDFKIYFTFSDDTEYGNSYTIEYIATYPTGGKANQYYVNGATMPDNLKGTYTENPQVGGSSVYSFKFILDDLSSEKTRFKSLYGSESGHNKTDSDHYELTEGSNLKLTVSLSRQDHRIDMPERKDLTTNGNSLFDYSDEKNATDKYFAISNGRHLQNLDSSSNCKNAKVGRAKVTGNIKLGKGSTFAETYKDYFNGTMNYTDLTTGTGETVPDFKSIQNSPVTEFEGNNHIISGLSTTGNGMYESINGSSTTTISNLKLTGERVFAKKGTAGGLIGTVNNNALTIDNIHIYLDKDAGDISGDISAEENVEAYRWIAADNTSGGLIGVNNGKILIKNSSVSTVLGNNTSVTGGLIGLNRGESTVETSYTDNYGYGKTVAGIVGSNEGTVTIKSSYTSGFIGVSGTEEKENKGAGFATGKTVTISDSYTVIAPYNIADDGGLSVIGDVDSIDYTYYRTVENGVADTVYYLRDSKNITDENKTDKAIKIGKIDKYNISLSSNFKFEDRMANIPYMLLGKSLTSYPYPMLNMEHYGDWAAEYEAGALVYYEIYKYKDENGNDIYSLGFDGANLDVTLIRDYDVVGDGYGVLYKADATDIPAKVSADVNGAPVDNILDVEPEKTTVNGIEYNIYPLSKDIVNPNTAISDFYERISLTAKSKDNAVVSTKYYDFNPHFARTVRWVTDKDSPISTLGTIITIRSPRQLYNLSKYYDGYRTVVEGKTFRQERNMVYSTYEWTNYTNENNTVTKQAPIGSSDATAFTANYDGGCYRIGDISFYTENGSYAGMFGYTKGNISNVSLLTQYSTDAKQVYRVERKEAVSQNEVLYAGILAGRNEGNITNCAVAGYYVAENTSSDDDGTIHGYQNSTLYIGGFVGYNSGEIRNCSSDNPKLSLKMTDANCYAGGFVGYNTGKALINNCYALISIEGNAIGGYTNISGFAAYNSSEIRNSYCASALTASGTATKAYAFGSNEGNGIESSDYYLSQGSYRFAGKLYAYGRSEMNGTGGTEAGSTGTSMLYEELAARKDLSPAVVQDYFEETKKAYGNPEEYQYPFRAVVRNAKGEYVHYGEWTVEPVLGTYGMFYWEHETSGQNNGYKFTYVGVVDDTIYTDSTLCDSHDDSGVITEYGYGYYISNKEGLTASLESTDISGMSESSIDAKAKYDLEKQVPGIAFYPYITYTENGIPANNKLYLSSEGQNGNLTLTVTNTKNNITKTLNYTVSPFFANALSLKTDNLNDFSVSSKNDEQYLDKTPGIAEADGKNSYEIRSIQQLQYINWNYSTKSTSSLVSTSNYTYFNYLMFTSNTNTSTQNKTQAGRYNEVGNIVFSQSHDLNAKKVENYVPIACTSTSSTVGGYDAVLYAWFGSTYNGQSYKIQELSISSNGYAVGLFGVTVGADLKNIIMYSGDSTKKAVIERRTDLTNDPEKLNNKAGAYSIGGLVGVAYDYASPVNRTITNCSIAGYIIRDESTNQLTLGESNVGGLIGVSNVNVDGCSAVVDIQENASHLLTGKLEDGISIAKYGNYIRVGGLCGAVQNKVTRSYTGGNITVGDTLLHETYATKNSNNNTATDYVEYGTEQHNKKASYEGSSHVFISGIAGSGFTMNYRNFSGSTGSKDGKPDVENCYTYVNFPTMEGTIRSISMIASVADRFGRYGDAKATIKNCYYLESSANLNYNNLPYYYFSGSSANSPARLYKWNDPKGKTSFDKLKDGDVRILFQIFENTDGGTNRKVSIENESSISYTSLSSDGDWKSILNNGLADDKKWGKVTIRDNKGNIDGKYSFNTGKSYLDGKNYPFPTIIKENETINVHYGEWPTNGPYWEQGTATIDLLSDLKGSVAEQTFTINKPYDDSKYELDFKFGENETSPYVYIDSIDDVKRENNTLKVTVHALKTGSQKITAVWTDKTTGEEVDEASFTVTVKCDFSIEADQRSLILGSGEEANITLSAKNSKGGDVDTSKPYFKWDKFVSRTLDPDVDDAGCSDVSDNTMTVTGQGNDAVITVTGTFIYNNIEYQSSVRINVRKQEFIGISDNTTFNEMNMNNNLIRNGVSYSEDNKPYLNNYSLYLYEYSTSALIKNVELQLVDSDGKVVNNSVVTCGEKITSGNYNYYPISIDTSIVNATQYSDDLMNVTIKVIKMNNTEINGTDESGNSASLALNISTVKLPQVIYLNDGKETVADPIKITQSVSKVDLKMVVDIPEGYFLEGWYADTEGKVKVLEADGTVINGNVDGYVTDGKLTFTSHSITLHPMYMRYKATKIPDQSSLDENGQYMMIHFGTSKYATRNGKSNGFFRNAKELDDNTFTFEGIGNSDGSVSYAISDYLYKADEIPQVTSDYIYQITEDRLYGYVAPATNIVENEQ